MYGVIFLAVTAAISQDFFYDQVKAKQIILGLPKVESESLSKILFSDQVRFYDTETLPMAYQDFRGSLRGIHSPFYNISANRSEPHGNGNKEFPWGKPAGTHRTDGVSTIKFMSLPTLEDKTVPIAYEYIVNDGYNWVYPRGTVFGEILYLNGDCFEIRTRTKSKEIWVIDTLRPYNSAIELREQIVKNFADYRKDDELIKLYIGADMVNKDAMILEDSQPNRRVFSSKIQRIILPGISKEKAISLLKSRPFRSAVGASWNGKSDGPTTVTVEEGFGIVPVKYDADFIEVTSKSCARCHDSTNKHVGNFDFARDWYGKIRGSDGIFSFHIFDKNCISYNGIGAGVTINAFLVDNGYIIHRSKVADDDLYFDVNRR